MITNATPWTVLSNQDGTANILDCYGNTIGQFTDWQNAEKCIKHVNNADILSEIENHLESIKESFAEIETITKNETQN